MDANPEADYGPQLNAVVWLLISVSAVFLFTRLYLKHCQNRGLWWDDWILLASWTALAAQAGLITHVVSLGYGKQWIPLQNLPFFGLPINILSTLLIIANLWGKTSFAVTLLRLPVRWMRTCVWCILASLTVALTASVVLVWVGCSPFKLLGRCVPVDMSVKYNVFSCVMDVALAFLPWKWIWSLQMNMKEKIGVLVAMTMGVFAGAAAAVKSTTIPGINGVDARASIPLLVWGNAEAAICVMAASIPILRFLARGNFRAPVPGGYETGETTAMTESAMTESGLRSTSTSAQAQTPFLRLPTQSQPPGTRSNHKFNVSTRVVTPKADDDSSDNDSIELRYYQTRPRSPVDFTRPAGLTI